MKPGSGWVGEKRLRIPPSVYSTQPENYRELEPKWQAQRLVGVIRVLKNDLRKVTLLESNASPRPAPLRPDRVLP